MSAKLRKIANTYLHNLIHITLLILFKVQVDIILFHVLFLCLNVFTCEENAHTHSLITTNHF